MKKTLDDKATEYMQAATKRMKRFSKSLGRKVDDDDLYVNGFTLGAYSGYVAGYRAAMKRKRS